MPPQITVIGTTRRLFDAIQARLHPDQFDVRFSPMDALTAESEIFSSSHLLIIDTRSETATDLAGEKHLFPAARKNGIPVLAVVDPARMEIIQKLIRFGIFDWLTVPLKKVELAIRIRNALKFRHFEREKKQTGNENHPAGVRPSFWAPELKQMADAPLNFSQSKFLQKVVDNIRKYSRAEIVLFLQPAKSDCFEIASASPSFMFNSKPVFSPEKFPPIREVLKSRSFLTVEKTAATEAVFRNFNSEFNCSLLRISLYPVFDNQKIAAVLLAGFTTALDRDRAPGGFMESAIQMIRLSIQFQRIKKSIQEQLDAQVWQFSYEFLDQIINQLTFGIVVIDEDRRIKYLNDIAAHLLGVSKTQAQFRFLSDFISENIIEAVLQPDNPPSGQPGGPELEMVGPDGEKFLIGFSVQDFVDESSGETGRIISFKDITQSREVQEEMRRMDRLASLGVMASGIAHEIRNPLAGIKAMAQTFQEELSSSDPQNEYVRRIIRQVNRLDDMLKTLFSYAKPHRPNRNFCSIHGIIQDVVTLLRQKISSHNIQLHENIASNLPEIFADSAQLQQILINLMLNGIESIENGGNITITVRKVTPAYDRFRKKAFYQKITEKPHVEIEIEDTGCGIPADNFKKIFNPFFTTKSFGTGLGLSIVYQIVKENDSVIYFDSVPEEGTKCYLFIPAFNVLEDVEEKHSVKWTHK